MKKLFLLLVTITVSFVYSQEQTSTYARKNELKLNAAALVAGAFEVSYERIIDDESTFGISLFATADDDIENKFMLTPYYRYYFGKKPAAGFFAEGFGSLNTYQDNLDFFSINFKPEKTTDFALGFGLGGKWITKRGVIFEIFGGFGRNLFNSDNSDFQVINRGGISVGYRFN